MTLPTDIIFPIDPALLESGSPQDLTKYMRLLTDSLTEMYADMVDNINGYMRFFDPVVYAGTLMAGVYDLVEQDGTYATQKGFYRRSGIMTDVWFDVSWTGNAETGTLIIGMPYQAEAFEGEPWIGVIESSSASNAFTVGYTYLNGQILENTYNLVIQENGTAVASQPLAIAADGGFRGHIRYVGKEIESGTDS